VRAVDAKVGWNTTTDIALVGELDVQYPERRSGQKSEQYEEQTQLVSLEHLMLSHHFFRYFSRNATVNFQASAASSAR
jgi:hypothetical protein